jgi:hypothetical protein
MQSKSVCFFTFISKISKNSIDKLIILWYYKIVRRSFTSALNKERRSMGTNDTALVAEHKGNHSASHMLMMFKQDEDRALEMFGRDPNLGDVRRVDIDKLVREQSKQFLRFLEDWRQTCRSETAD